MNARAMVLSGFVALALATSFLCGARVAASEPDSAPPAKDDPRAVVQALEKRQAALRKDLDTIERAARDVIEIRETRAEGFELSREEQKLERKGRADLHIFMERARNDALETLAIYDRLLEKGVYVEPLRRVFGPALDEIVAVRWSDERIENIIDELARAYGVKIGIKGDLDYRRTISLEGDMSLISILLYLENTSGTKLEATESGLWFMPLSRGAKD